MSDYVIKWVFCIVYIDIANTVVSVLIMMSLVHIMLYMYLKAGLTFT